MRALTQRAGQRQACTTPICSPARAASARPRYRASSPRALNCTGPDGCGGVTAEPCGACQACTEIDADRYIDYIELDAASNRGIDEARDLIERARLQAEHRPLQGVHDRRGAPAHEGRLQRAAQDAGGAAGVSEVRAGDHRSRQDAAHGAEPLPAVQPAADATADGARASGARAGRREGGARCRLAALARARRARLDARRVCR